MFNFEIIIQVLLFFSALNDKISLFDITQCVELGCARRNNCLHFVKSLRLRLIELTH